MRLSEYTATTPTSASRYVDPKYTDSILSALLAGSKRTLGRPPMPRQSARSLFLQHVITDVASTKEVLDSISEKILHAHKKWETLSDVEKEVYFMSSYRSTAY